jgi:hypothetical protein
MPPESNEEEGRSNVDIDPQVPITIRRVPTSFRRVTFTNEAKQDKEVPVKRCAVCCRLLYKEEYFALRKDDQNIIEEKFFQARAEAMAEGATPESVQSMTWPLLNYCDNDGMRIRELDVKPGGKHSGSIVVCSRHKSGRRKDLDCIFSYVSWRQRYDDLFPQIRLY